MTGAPLLASLLLAFLGGALGLLAPCGALLLPTFFSYTFGTHRRTLVRMAVYYYLGLVTLFVPFGLGVTFLLRLVIFQHELLFATIGLGIVLLGAVSIMRPIALPPVHAVRQGGPATDVLGIYLLGLSSGLTTGTCTAPILGSILTLAAASRTYTGAAGLLLVYAGGMVAALLVFSLFFHRLARPFGRWWSGWVVRVPWPGRVRTLPGQQLVRGLFVMGVGVLFLLTQGTFGLETVYQQAGLTGLAYQLNVALLSGDVLARVAGGSLAVGATASAWWAWRHRLWRPQSPDKTG
jgi:cytochrome c biogenesis protein CcdA